MVKVLIVGGGPAGLLCAEQISKFNVFDVHVIDHKKAVGRKFLVAGDGGLNLTNDLPIEEFVHWYSDEKIKNSVRHFMPINLKNWFQNLGIDTYFGSSGKLFPKVGIKPIEVLNAITNRLKEQNVTILTQTRVLDWEERSVLLASKGVKSHIDFDVIVFAMGGGSWSNTGSDGKWFDFVCDKVQCNPFSSSNAGVEVEGGFMDSYRGEFLKNVIVHVADVSMLGEVRFTDYGLEGTPIYALNPYLKSSADLFIDLKPHFSKEDLLNMLSAWRNSRTDFLKSLKLGFGLRLLKDFLSKEEFQKDELLVERIKRLPFKCTGLRPLEEAISSKGGVGMNEVDSNFESVSYPNTFFIGEMLDWDTRTGGFLLQACFSSGYSASQCIINRYVVD